MGSTRVFQRVGCAAGVGMMAAMFIAAIGPVQVASAGVPAVGDFMAGSGAAVEAEVPVLGLDDYVFDGASMNGQTQGSEQISGAALPANTELTGGALNSAVTVTATTTTATSSVATLSINVPGGPIVIRGVSSEVSDSRLPTGAYAPAVGSSNIALLQVGSTKYVNENPAPNTVIPLGTAGDIILNQQVAASYNPAFLTINAVTVELPSLGIYLEVASVGTGERIEPSDLCTTTCGGLLGNTIGSLCTSTLSSLCTTVGGIQGKLGSGIGSGGGGLLGGIVGGSGVGQPPPSYTSSNPLNGGGNGTGSGNGTSQAPQT